MKTIFKKVMCFAGLIALSTSVYAAEKQYTIAGIVFQNDLFMRTIQIGMQHSAKEHKVTLLLANSDNKVDKEAQLIDTYIARKVDAIAITPISAKGSVAALKRAHDAGIKIILFNSLIDADIYQSYINSDQKELGMASGKEAVTYINDHLKDQDVEVATLSFRAQLPEVAEARSSGFTSQVLALHGVKVVAEQDAWLAEKAIAVVGDMITAHPNLKIIHAANEGGTVGAVQAVKNAGKQDQIKVFGTDGSDQIAQMLTFKDNILQAAAAQQPYVIGSKAIDVAVSVLKGEPVEKTIIVPAHVLKRSDPEDIKKFREQLRTYR